MTDPLSKITISQLDFFEVCTAFDNQLNFNIFPEISQSHINRLLLTDIVNYQMMKITKMNSKV